MILQLAEVQHCERWLGVEIGPECWVMHSMFMHPILHLFTQPSPVLKTKKPKAKLFFSPLVGVLVFPVKYRTTEARYYVTSISTRKCIWKCGFLIALKQTPQARKNLVISASVRSKLALDTKSESDDSLLRCSSVFSGSSTSKISGKKKKHFEQTVILYERKYYCKHWHLLQ